MTTHIKAMPYIILYISIKKMILNSNMESKSLLCHFSDKKGKNI